MQHCDDEVLALVALGEPPSLEDARHLAGCARCRAEVESFDRVVTAGRPEPFVGPVVQPPSHVWDGIAAATGVNVRPRPPEQPLPAGAEGTGSRGPGGPPASQPPPPPSEPQQPSAPPAPGQVVALRPRSRRSRPGWLPLVAVAASALVVGGVVGSLGTRLLQPSPTREAPVVVARAALDPLPVDPAASGSAVVVQAGGTRTLEVDVSKLARTDGFYEVWLIDSSVKKMVPVGILTGSRGTFTIPADLDLGQFPVVDISAEPLDGDPTHSGESLVRGVIPG